MNVVDGLEVILQVHHGVHQYQIVYHIPVVVQVYLYKRLNEFYKYSFWIGAPHPGCELTTAPSNQNYANRVFTLMKQGLFF
jgi:hypothetical protein